MIAYMDSVCTVVRKSWFERSQKVKKTALSMYLRISEQLICTDVDMCREKGNESHVPISECPRPI